jgi:hypothetical protein
LKSEKKRFFKDVRHGYGDEELSNESNEGGIAGLSAGKQREELSCGKR